MPDIELLHAEYERRRYERIRIAVQIILSWVFVLSLFYLGFTSSTGSPADYLSSLLTIKKTVDRNAPTFLSQLGIIKDTLYTLMPSFLEVDLDSQKLFHRRRDGRINEYDISTGTERLKRGKETTEGIFVIQSKIDWIYSLQFDSAKVFNWLGFNYGIGFHSLEGNRYYAHLGKHRSSHGCIRLSREAADSLYRIVDTGTPVIVRKTQSARVVAFLRDSSLADTTHYSRNEVRAIYHARLKSVYQGKKFYFHYPIIALSRQYVTHDGLPLGDEKHIPLKQKLPHLSDEFAYIKPEKTNFRMRQFDRWNEREEVLSQSELEKEVLP